MTETFDIAIIGGGIAGISLAFFAARHRSVAVLEAESALGYHASGRSAAEFTERFHSPEVGRLAAMSFPFLTRPPEGFAETELLKRRGNLLIASAEKKARLAEVFAAESAGASGLERLSVDEAVARAPILDPAWLADAFFDPECFDVEAENLLQGFARGARAADAQILTGARVEAVERDGDVWVLKTQAGAVRARTLVNAAGAWADRIAELCGIRQLSLLPHRRTAITVDVPEGIDIGALPEINEIDEQFYFKPEAGRLLVSPADETPSEPCDAQPEEIDIAYAAYYLEEATTIAVRHVAHSWAGLRTFAPDRLPVVGYSGAGKDFFWLAGQGGYGIQTAPALAMIAANLITEGAVEAATAAYGIAPEAFSPARLSA